MKSLQKYIITRPKLISRYTFLSRTGRQKYLKELGHDLLVHLSCNVTAFHTATVDRKALCLRASINNTINYKFLYIEECSFLLAPGLF